jgi:hypothetical protein
MLSELSGDHLPGVTLAVSSSCSAATMASLSSEATAIAADSR